MAWQVHCIEVSGLFCPRNQHWLDRGLQPTADLCLVKSAADRDHSGHSNDHDWNDWGEDPVTMTTLTFPNLVDFIEYLKENEVRRVGLVTIHRTDPAQRGTAIYTASFRLTAIRYLDVQSVAKELLICDIPYYSSLFVTEKINREEAQKPKEDLLKKILKDIEEFTKAFNYELKILNCKFDH